MKISKRIKCICILAGVIISIGTLVGASTAVFGAATDGNEPIFKPTSPDPDAPSPDPGTTWWGGRYATWIRYEVNGNNDIYFKGVDTRYESYDAKTLHGCVDDKAEYYYKLSPNWYEIAEDGSHKLIAQQAPPIISVSSLAPAGGKVTYATDAQAAIWNEQYGEDTFIDLATAHDYFNKTIAAGMNNGVSWEDVGAFCWSEKLLCDPADPACNPPVPATGDAIAYFESTSTINLGSYINTAQVAADPSNTKYVDATTGDITTDRDNKLEIEFSTDQDNVTITFKHNMYYLATGFSKAFGDAYKPASGDKFVTKDTANKTDVADTINVFTPYTITVSEDGKDISSMTHSQNTNRYVATNNSELAKTDSSGSTSISYIVKDIPEGGSKKVCSKIAYTQKTANFKKKEDIEYITLPDGHVQVTSRHDDWYLDSYANNEDSEICATIVHPASPSGSSGMPGSDIMFAGEDTRLGRYNYVANGIPTFRLKERSIIGYLVSAETPYNPSLVAGGGGSPCAHYSPSPLTGITDCYTFPTESQAWDTDVIQSVNDAYNNEIAVKVPNNVGGKYCNSGGYNFQRYFSFNGTWFEDKRPGQNVWYTFDSTCRTIAKKPTMAVWNGSILTEGSVWTSIARRFNSINFGELTNEGTTETNTFGSWTEFLSIAGGKVHSNKTDFASGATLYTGFKNSAPNSNLKFYPLTISNATLADSTPNLDKVGLSGIKQSQTLLNRLYAYLKDNDKKFKAKDLGNTTSGIIAKKNEVTSHIYRVNGDLEITGNITISDSTYDNIYEIPQIIIFVNGDVNISSDVTQIDAWIIADGTINTCAAYKDADVSNGEYGTQADPSGRSAPNVCTKQLIFNGPVFAKDMKLNRSFGSDAYSATGDSLNFSDVTTKGSSREAPAEIFNLRSDVYLWAYAQSSRYDSSYTETYSRELAPRY